MAASAVAIDLCASATCCTVKGEAPDIALALKQATKDVCVCI